MTATTLLHRLDWLSRLRTIMVLRGGQRHVMLPDDGVDVRGGRNTLHAGGGDWWTAGGAPTPVVVYQPKGAASLELSYKNLVNPGTYNAAPGTAPTLDASGWVFNGSTQYLDTTYIMASVSASTIVRFSNSLEGAFAWVIGSRSSNSAVYYGITPYRSSVLHRFWNSNAGVVDKTPAVVSGTMAIAGSTGYVNGAPDSALTISSVTGNSIKIASFEPTWGFWGGSIQAVAIWNTSTDHAIWMPAVSAAVALI